MGALSKMVSLQAYMRVKGISRLGSEIIQLLADNDEGMSVNSISKVVRGNRYGLAEKIRGMEADGLVRMVGEERSSRGRRMKVWALDKKGEEMISEGFKFNT